MRRHKFSMRNTNVCICYLREFTYRNDIFVSQMCNTWIGLSQTVNCNAIVIPNDTVLAGVDDLLKVLGRDSLILQACLLKSHNWI
jgi:hypothetical protein